MKVYIVMKGEFRQGGDVKAVFRRRQSARDWLEHEFKTFVFTDGQRYWEDKDGHGDWISVEGQYLRS